MPRVDDYIAARARAAEILAKDSLERIAGRSGLESVKTTGLLIPFLDRTYRIGYPDFQFADMDGDRTIPLQEQVLILDYLMGNPPEWLKGRWVAYREIPGAQFYFSAFLKRAVDPLKKRFGQDAAALARASEKLKGRPLDVGDVSYEFQVFPKVPVQVIVYLGDEEFPAEAAILFDESVGDVLSPEDIAWMSGMLVYRLMSFC